MYDQIGNQQLVVMGSDGGRAGVVVRERAAESACQPGSTGVFRL